jgi:hypothetical protein
VCINTTGLASLVKEGVIVLVISCQVGGNSRFFQDVNPIRIFSKVSGIGNILYNYFLQVLWGGKRKGLWLSRADRLAVRRIWAWFTIMANMYFESSVK